MTVSYQSDDLNFQYPANWTLDEDPPHGLPRAITLTARTGSFWTVLVYPADVPLQQLSQQYLETMRKEYESIEVEEIEFELPTDGAPICWKGQDLHFFCLDFVVRSRVFTTVIGNRHLMINWQAEDRDFSSLEPIFVAITISMLRES